MEIRIQMFKLVILTLTLGLVIPLWKEKDGKIIRESVCYNEKYGSLRYRDCRKKAAKIFREGCKKKIKKMCDIDSRFNIIN